MSKERPILFNGDMVRAILAGRKTQTRRAVKLPHNNPLGQWEASTVGGYGARDSKRNLVPEQACIWHTRTGDTLVCPLGDVGNRIWVRESFWGCDLPGYGDQPCVVYDDEWQGNEYRPAEARPWARKFGRIPAIHMPRDACRLVLEISAVRVERLQDISEADALAEGIEGIGGRFTFNGGRHESLTARSSFMTLWDSTGGMWVDNPWVWVVEFKQVTA